MRTTTATQAEIEVVLGEGTTVPGTVLRTILPAAPNKRIRGETATSWTTLRVSTMLSRRDPLGFGCVWVRPMDHLDLDDDPVVAGVVDGADAVLDEVVVGGGGGDGLGHGVTPDRTKDKAYC